MELQALNFWEIALDIIQICLCGFVILFLILNRIKFRQLILRAPSEKPSRHAHSDFVIEAIRQQTELAFGHIAETIEKERQVLDAYFDKRDQQIAPAILTPVTATPPDQHSGGDAPEADPAGEIYSEIERLADQGLSLTDISERLKVPQGEVDLVLKLKHLSAKTVNKKSHPPA